VTRIKVNGTKVTHHAAKQLTLGLVHTVVVSSTMNTPSYFVMPFRRYFISSLIFDLILRSSENETQNY